MSRYEDSIYSCTSPADLIGVVANIVRQQDGVDSFSSFSTSIYDTAWLSMVRKPSSTGQEAWLFPESFHFVLQSQQDNGTWPSYASPVDGILNTLACILALLVHKSIELDSQLQIDLSRRIQKAHQGLALLLESWNPDETIHVAFEILVPSLLSQVAQHGIDFEFAGRQKLLTLYKQKMELLKPEYVYSEQPTTLLHSLEVLVGLVDFDKVRHHCSKQSGVLGSPAATSAYLINCSQWDARAELYLQDAVTRFGNCGAVPTVFPTPYFEISWAISNLLSGVVSHGNIELNDRDVLSSFLESGLIKQSGIIGFGLGILADVDDTGRCNFALQQLGRDTDLRSMVENFKSTSEPCFKTYQMERNPSISSNCNALLALIHSSAIKEYSILIHDVARYLLTAWASHNISDKWNLSPFYSYMLVSDAFVSFLEKADKGSFGEMPTDLTENDIPITLCQMLSSAVQNQHENGSWRDCVQETAYCILMFTRCLCLPWETNTRTRLVECYNQAVWFISSVPLYDRQRDYVWAGKVTYSPLLLHKAYHLAALHSRFQTAKWSDKLKQQFGQISLQSDIAGWVKQGA